MRRSDRSTHLKSAVQPSGTQPARFRDGKCNSRPCLFIAIYPSVRLPHFSTNAERPRLLPGPLAFSRTAENQPFQQPLPFPIKNSDCEEWIGNAYTFDR
jgi:hypothetical protein